MMQEQAEAQRAWTDFASALTGYLGEMTADTGIDGNLLIGVPSGDDEHGCAPYAQFASTGTTIRAELSGNLYLASAHELSEESANYLRLCGWQGNDEDEPNWYVEAEDSDVDVVATEVAEALHHHFGVPHPTLMTCRAWGAGAENAIHLGLTGSEEVAIETTPVMSAVDPTAVHLPSSPDQTRDVVAALLRDELDLKPEVDSDGDLVVTWEGQPVFVRADPSQPMIKVFARVAHDVHSRRRTAIEVGLLNRDHPWAKWLLDDRSVLQTMAIPAMPLVPAMVKELLLNFFLTMTATRADLVLRTGGVAA